MTTALAPHKDRLQGASGLSEGTPLRQAATFLAGLVKPPEFDPDGADDYFDGLLEAGGWARRFYGVWAEGLSPEEYSALEEYKREGFRKLNRGLRDHEGNLSMLPPEDRLRAEGLDAALKKAPPLDEPVVVYRGRLPDAVLTAFEAGEEETLLGRVFGDPAYTSTSLDGRIARAYGGSSRFPDSMGRITLPKGTRAGCVDAILDKGQSELLLPRGARVRIDQAYREGGVYRIEGRLIPWHLERRFGRETRRATRRSRVGRFGWPEGETHKEVRPSAGHYPFPSA